MIKNYRKTKILATIGPSSEKITKIEKLILSGVDAFRINCSHITEIPYFINIPDKETIYFAGIWKYFNFKKSTTKVFSIITKPSNNLLKEIHTRMPVTFSSDESKDFLDNLNPNYLVNNVHSLFERYFEYYEVSKFVNNPINNTSECIKPIN